MKKFINAVASLLLILMLLVPMLGFAQEYEGYTQEEFDNLQVTTVIQSDSSPTGYYVTFRFPPTPNMIVYAS